MIETAANILNKRFSAKLAAGGTYAPDVALAETLDIDESRMSVWINFADGRRRDGVGDLTEVGGIKTDRHIVNPIVLFDHGKNIQLPIALAEDPETKAYTVILDPIEQVGRGNAFFYQGTGLSGVERGKEKEHALFCEQLYHLIAQRFIRAGSFAYTVVKAVNLQPDYERGTPAGLHLLVTLLLEFGPTVIPANQDTVRKLLSDDLICGKHLSPVLVKSLQPYAGEKVVQMGYEGKVISSELIAKEAAAKEKAQKSQLPHIREGYIQCPCGKRYYTEEMGKACCDKEISMLRGMKSQVPVPLDHLPTAPIPPARWNPGLGAEKKKRKRKALRMKHKKAMGDQIKCGECGATFTVDDSQGGQCPKCGWRPTDAKGMKGLTREQGLAFIRRHYTQEYSARDAEAIAREVQTYTSDADWANYRSERELQEDIDGNFDFNSMYDRQIRSSYGKKAIDLKALRNKYRRTKGLRRRMKRSSPGSSIMHVAGKDLDGVREAAKAKGLKFAHLGTHVSGAAKVKLMGDDEAIDAVAKQFGRKVKSMETKAKGSQPPTKGKSSSTDVRSPTSTETSTSTEAYTAGNFTSTVTGGAGDGDTTINIYMGEPCPFCGEIDCDGDCDESKTAGTSSLGTSSVGIKPPKSKSVRRVMKPRPNIIGDKNMADKKPITREVKSAPAGMRTKDNAQAEELAGEPVSPEDIGDEGHEAEKSDEKYSSQLLRQMHENANILLQEYDEAMGPLEHEEIGNHLKGKLEALVDEIEEIESLHSEHHPEATPLEAGGEKDLPEEEESSDEAPEEESPEDVQDDEANEQASEADSSNAEEVPAEDAVEGMKKDPDEKRKDPNEKRLTRKQTKALKWKHRRKSMNDEEEMEDDDKGMKCATCGKRGCSCSKSLKSGLNNVKTKGWECLECGKKFATVAAAEKASMNGCPKCGGVDIDLLPDKSMKDLDTEELQYQGVNEGSLADHERSKVSEARSFLNELSTTTAFGDEHRMKSYHYHKALGDIAGTAIGAAAGGPVGAAAGGAVGGELDKSADDLGKEENQDKPGYDETGGEIPNEPGNEENQKSQHPHRKACGMASAYFKALSAERAYGDFHRTMAGEHAKALDEIDQAQADAEVQEGDGEEPEPIKNEEPANEPGEMGEKAAPTINLNRLKKLFDQQNKDMADMAKKLQSIKV